MERISNEDWERLQQIRKNIQGQKIVIQTILEEMRKKLLDPVADLNKSLAEARKILGPISTAVQDHYVVQSDEWKISDEGCAYADWSNMIDDIDTDLCGDFQVTEDPKEMIGDIGQIIQDLGDRLKKEPSKE